MKRLLCIMFVLVILSFSRMDVDVYAAQLPEETAGNEEGYFPQSVLDNPASTETDYLRAILICVKDIDVYVQFFVTLVFAIGLTYFVILKPVRYFLN